MVLNKLEFSNQNKLISHHFYPTFVGSYVNFEMIKAKLKKAVVKIKKLMRQRDYDNIDIGIELAPALDEPAIFEALLGGWSINEEGKLVLEEEYKGETFNKEWSDKSLTYFTFSGTIAYAYGNLVF